jgi:hypothetical protein
MGRPPARPDASGPELAIAISSERFAPRVARQAVAQLDNPSPDLRDAVMLLTSNIVTLACRGASDAAEMIELRAWMPRTLVRVEVWAVPDLLGEDQLAHDLEAEWDRELLSALADRWGVEHGRDRTEVWFEIDRRADARD